MIVEGDGKVIGRVVESAPADQPLDVWMVESAKERALVERLYDVLPRE